MPALHVVSGRAVPTQIHRGTYPRRALMRPVASTNPSWVVDSSWPAGGLWTSTLTEWNTTAWTEMCLRTGHRADELQEDWVMVPRPDARVVVVDSQEDYDALIARYGYTVGGPYFSAWLIHWERLGRDYDALRVTEAGIRTAHNTYHSALLGWGLESTIWLRWCFADVTLADELGQIGGWRPRGERHYAVCDADLDAFCCGIALLDAFRPELQSAYLRIPVTAPPETYGLAIAMSRLNSILWGMPPVWPETDTPVRQQQLAADRWRAVVEIRNRRALGMVVTRWARIVAGATPAPILQALIVCGVHQGRWGERAERLSHAALRANGMTPGTHMIPAWGPCRRVGGVAGQCAAAEWVSGAETR